MSSETGIDFPLYLSELWLSHLFNTPRLLWRKLPSGVVQPPTITACHIYASPTHKAERGTADNFLLTTYRGEVKLDKL